MDDHFCSSLHELKQQLDLMNQRTALFLRRHSLQNYSDMSSRDPNIFDQRPVPEPQTVPMQQFDKKLHALKVQQEARFKDLDARFIDLETEVDALSDAIDEMRSGNPQFTPPESPSSPASSTSPTSPTSSTLPVHKTLNCNSSPLDTPTMSNPPATVADIGGYLYPSSVRFGLHHDNQYISDVSVFVGRVNRALRTKSIANIETFLRGSALRWFHLGLSLDGSHTFDDENGQINTTKFCESLIVLFGLPEFIATGDSYEQTQCLMLASMRSNVLEDYAFPALEALRRQSTVGQPDADAHNALRQAVLRYNKDHPSFTVDPDILGSQDVLVNLAQLRQREFDSRRDRALTHQKQRGEKAKSDQIPADSSSTSNPIREQTSFHSTDTDASEVGQEDTHTKRQSYNEDECILRLQTEEQRCSKDQERKVGTQSMFEEDKKHQYGRTETGSRTCRTQKPLHKTKRSTRTVVQPGTFWSNSRSTTSGTHVEGEADSGISRSSDVVPQSMFSFPCLAADSCPTPLDTLCPPSLSNLNLTPDVNRRLKNLRSTTSHDAPDSNRSVQDSNTLYRRARPFMPSPAAASSYSAAEEPLAPANLVKSHMMCQQPLSNPSAHLVVSLMGPLGSFPSAKNHPSSDFFQLNTTDYAPYTAVDSMSGYPMLHPACSLPANIYNPPSINTGSKTCSTSNPAATPVLSTQNTNYNPLVNTGVGTFYSPNNYAGPPPAASMQMNTHVPPRQYYDHTTTVPPSNSTFLSPAPDFMTPLEAAEMAKEMERLHTSTGSNLRERHSDSKVVDPESKGKGKGYERMTKM